jgi:heat shock protein HslJ
MSDRNTRQRSAAAMAVMIALLAGCGGRPADPAQDQPAASVRADPPEPAGGAEASAPVGALPETLTDTQWRLVEFQSMDDAIGTQRPEDSGLYTLQLNADGTVAMRLNCNSARGTWSADASADGSSGRFELGPLAMTRALCPPPSMDEQIAQQAQYIRSYILRGRRLYLSLMADGGIYAWEPLTDGHFEATPDPEIEAALLRAAPDYRREIVDIGAATGPARYVYAPVDLNDDGRDEVLVYLLGSFFCGTGGCNLMVLQPDADGYELVSELSISRTPIVVSASRSAGWRDLWQLQSGGGAPPSYVRHYFDGEHYVEGERVPGNETPPGDAHLTGELSYDNGVVLQPNE